MKKILLLISIISTISLSNSLSVGYKGEINGFVYKDINKLSFYKENNVHRFNLLNFEYSNKNFEINTSINEDIIYKEKIKKDKTENITIDTNIKFGDMIKFKTGVKTTLGNDYFNDIKDKTFIPYLEFNLFNRLYLKNETTLEKNVLVYNNFTSKLQTSFGNFSFSKKDPLSFERKYKLLSSKQEKLIDSDDNHNHGNTGSTNLDNLNFSIERSQEILNKNYTNKTNIYTFEYSKAFYVEKHNLDINIGSNYSYLDIENKYDDIFKTNLNEHKYSLFLGLNKEINEDLNIGLNFKYDGSILSEKEFYHNRDYLYNLKYYSPLRKNDAFEKLENNKISLALNINYDTNLINKLRFYTNNTIALGLDFQKQSLKEEIYNLRKNSYNAEKSRVEEELANLPENHLELKANLESEINQLINDLNNHDFTEALERAKSRLNSTPDIEERYNKFLELYSKKSIDEINEIFSSKSKERLEITKTFPRSFLLEDSRARRNSSKDDYITFLKDYGQRNDIDYLINHSEEYFDLYEHTLGVYGSLKSAMINDVSILNRQIKSKQRDLANLNPSIDKTIAKNYLDYENGKKKLNLSLELNSNLGLEYSIDNNFKVYTTINTILEFNKDLLNKESKWKNHIHFIPSVGLKYTFD